MNSTAGQVAEQTEHARGRFIAIDRQEFPTVAWFRHDFANESLGGLMNRLAVLPNGILVSQQIMDEFHVQIGDNVPLQVAANNDLIANAMFSVVGSYTYFPTVYEEEDPLTIVGNMEFISALVVPEFEKLEEYAKFNDIPFEDRSRLVNDERVMNFMQSEVERSTPSLSSYEQVKRIALLDRDFEIDRGEITPTLKIKRNIIEDKYDGIIQSLYREE